MEWYYNYSINVESIDNQHKELVNIISQLQESLSTGESNDKIRSALKFIVEYTKYHFTAEEEVMENEGFPELESHRKIHKNLIKDVKKILVGLKKGKSVNVLELIDFLTDWLITHIAKEDKRIGHFIERKNKTTQKADNFTKKDFKICLESRMKTIRDLQEEGLISANDSAAKKLSIIEKSVPDPELLKSEENTSFIEKVLDEFFLDEKDSTLDALCKKIALIKALHDKKDIKEKLAYLKSLLEGKTLSEAEYNQYKFEFLTMI